MSARILALVLGIQLLFTGGDLIARAGLRTAGFTPEAFLQPWFAVYVLARVLASAGQLYILASVELGKTAALFAAASVVVANALGPLLLGEVLTPRSYVGVTLALCALVVLAGATLRT